MSAFTTIIVGITKTNTKSLTVGKKSARNLIEYFRIQKRCFLRFWSWRCCRFRTIRRNKFACSNTSSSISAILFALIFPRAERASTFDISAERNVWLQSPLQLFTIVCDYMETALFAIACDPRSSAIIWKPAFTTASEGLEPRGFSGGVTAKVMNQTSQRRKIFKDSHPVSYTHLTLPTKLEV